MEVNEDKEHKKLINKSGTYTIEIAKSVYVKYYITVLYCVD